ncbi:efflux transporter outer membrane subunit [Roseateles sp.]|uniref:efflux transporter outer membrane subunit n=1 Tax=Roseateles sp. TaxID=1971397 RepID=UPI0039EBEE77
MLGLAAVVAGCSTAPVGPDYRVPGQALALRTEAATGFQQAQPAIFTSAPLPAHWWRLYGDTQLDALVQEALEGNTDLRQAVANLERVRAIEDEVAGGRRPTLGVGGGPSFGHASGLSMLRPSYEPPNAFHYSASLGLSYQMDPFGQLQRALEAAVAGSAAAEAARDLVRVQVAAGVARAYAETCATGLRLRSAEHSLALQEEAVALTERMRAAGRVGAIDAARARRQAEQLRAALPPLQAQRQGALYRLATLSGRLPESFPQELAGCSVPPQLAATAIPVGDGAALLRRRPDIRQAERELAAATARIGVQIADRYPKVNLGLSVASAGALDGFARRDTLAWSLGPLISWSLPDTGVVDARIAQAEAGARVALARFDGTVLTALRETESALNVYARELDRRAALQAARDEAATVAAQARRLYQGGKVGYLDALDAERALADSEAALAGSEAALVDEQVQLFLALGGGWES